jgi:hypothetical protein
LLRSQVLGLLACRFFQHARGQSLGGGVGHLLHLGQIDVEARPLFAESTT